MPDQGVTKSQIKSIHMALSILGIEDEIYRKKLSLMFGVDSCKQLSRRQASTLLKSLGRPMPAPVKKRRVTQQRRKTALNNSNVVELPTPAQHQLISDLVGEVQWKTTGGYRAWLAGNLKIQMVSTKLEAMRVIEGLKAMRRRQSTDVDGNR